MTDPYDTPHPIQVTEGSITAQIGALARYLITAVGAFALGKGWIDNDTLVFITGLVTVVAPAAYGIYRTWATKRTIVTLANAVDDSVAQVVQKP